MSESRVYTCADALYSVLVFWLIFCLIAYGVYSLFYKQNSLKFVPEISPTSLPKPPELKLNIEGPGDVAVPSIAESTADILELARTREAHKQESAEVSSIKNRE